MQDKWTKNNIPHLTGKVIIVTGANSGLGFQDAKAFASNGATVIMACRNLEKANTAKKRIQKQFPEAQLDVIQLDLMNLDSIKKFAEDFKQKYDKLDVLVNNAGIMMVPYRKTKDGFESQMGTNHLGHFALTAHLYEILAKTQGSRIVNESSLAHRSGKIDFDNFLFENEGTYNRSQAYSNSKLANLLFTYELDRRFKKQDVNIIAIAAHPGISNTNLADHMLGGKWFAKILRGLFFWFYQSAAKGALPTIRAAVDPNVEGGQYYGPKGVFGGEAHGLPEVVESIPRSHSEEDAKQLWEISEQLTGIKFSI